MQIVVLDGYTMNPGDLSWDPLKALGPCAVYDRSSPKEVIPRAAGAEIVLTNKVVLNRTVIEQLPRLQYIGVTATGYNVVDLAAARARKITVTNVPAYGTASVAQMTFALLLELTQRVAYHAQTVRENRWAQAPDFCYWDYPLVELAGLTMGIVGLGRIGEAVSRLAMAFGMTVLAYTRPVPAQMPQGVKLVELETLFRKSDVITLHCPLTAETHNLVDAQRLSWVKPTAFLLNTSRGPLVDQHALADALNQGRLAGAGLDVLAVEPPSPDNPLLTAKNCFITPHIAWGTRAARARLMDIVVENIRAFLAGRPQNVVNE